MCAPRATQCAGLHQRPHGLLEEERVPFSLLDEPHRESLEPGIFAEEDLQVGVMRVAGGGLLTVGGRF